MSNDDLAYFENQLNMPMAGMGGVDSNSVYNHINSQETNLIQWQLELDNILERIEHLLKGDVIIEDSEGNIRYTKPNDDNLIVLNDYGVQLIMNIISFYLNRNTILSNYTSDRIYEILFDLGNELADLIYINYEKMGLNSVEKRSRYPVLVMNILHIVESSYNRALSGEERESLRSARVVTQNQAMNPNQNNNSSLNEPRRRFSLNPFKRS